MDILAGVTPVLIGVASVARMEAFASWADQ